MQATAMDVDDNPESMNMEDAIALMSKAVQAGEFTYAETLGRTAPFPLSIPKASLNLGRALFEGAQATVYEATLENLEGDTSSRPVAVKRVRIRQAEDLPRFRREVELLAQAQHPHIVELIGARLLPPDYMLVLGLEATNAAHELHTAGWRPGWPGAIALGAQLAAATAHLHATGILHRDLKPGNLLLSADRRTSRLTDLGIAVSLQEAAEIHSGAFTGAKPTGGFHKAKVMGTLEYMPPEVLLKRPHSAAADVFALAVVINEMAAAQVPYGDCTRDNPLAHTILEMGYGRQELAAAVAAEGLRPTIAPMAPPAMLRLLRSCWDADPTRRPTAAQVASVLEEMRALLPWNKEDIEGVETVDENGSRSSMSAHNARNGNGGAANSNNSDTQQQNSTTEAPSSLLVGEFDPLEKPSWVSTMLNSQQPAPPPLKDTATTTTTTSRTTQLPVPSGSFATAGARGEDKMEDRCIIIRSLCGVDGCLLTGVFDGHRGAAAAEYLASNIERHIEARWAASTSPGSLLRDALLDADEEYRQREDTAWNLYTKINRDNSSQKRRPYPGSTATVALLIGRHLTVANLGDSRAVLCRNDEAIHLTQDQTADREDERIRIAAAGGHASIRPVGGWRVGDAGLAVTRSIGDADVKGQGVTAEAEITDIDIDFNKDSFLIIATDGVWDKLSGEDAVGVVHDTVKQPAMCAQRIVTEALARGSQDNVTAVVAFLGDTANMGTAERVFHKGQAKYGGTAAAKRVAARLVEDEVRETY